MRQRNQAEAAPRPVELDWRSTAIWHSRPQTLGGARLPWRSATGVVRRRRRQPADAAIDAGPTPWRGTQGATGASPVPPAPSSPYHKALVPEVRRRQVIRRSPTYPRTSKEMSPCSSVSTLSTIRRSASIFSDVEHPGLYQMPSPISKP